MQIFEALDGLARLDAGHAQPARRLAPILDIGRESLGEQRERGGRVERRGRNALRQGGVAAALRFVKRAAFRRPREPARGLPGAMIERGFEQAEMRLVEIIFGHKALDAQAI